MSIKINIICKSGKMPQYATVGAAGMDICAFVDEDIVLEPMERALIPTGLFVAIPKGYEAQIRARSGLAIKNGIGLVNGIGTIDSDYRGEIKVPLINFSKEPFVIKDGDRIAQMVIAAYENIEWEPVEILDATDRNQGGFGHTGV